MVISLKLRTSTATEVNKSNSNQIDLTSQVLQSSHRFAVNTPFHSFPYVLVMYMIRLSGKIESETFQTHP